MTAGLADKASSWTQDGDLPGLQLLTMTEGEIDLHICDGFADLERRRPVTDQTLFRLASASKIFVSAAFLTLIDDGNLGLKDPVANYLPAFNALTRTRSDGASIAACNTMTVEDLLRHSCGYGYGNSEPYRTNLIRAGLLHVDTFGYDNWSTDLSLKDWANYLATVPLEDEPGTRTVYGLGHDLPGALMEAVTGLPLDEIVETRLLTPLGLNNTFFVVPEDRQPDLTCFYDLSEGSRPVLVEDAADSHFLKRPSSFSGGGGWDMLGNGGLVSSVTDFSTLLQMILQRGSLAGQALLKPETADLLRAGRTGKLQHPHILPGCEYSYGFACVTDDSQHPRGPEGKLWWGGSTNTFYFFTPASKRLGVFLTHGFPFGHQNAIYHFDKLAS